MLLDSLYHIVRAGGPESGKMEESRRYEALIKADGSNKQFLYHFLSFGCSQCMQLADFFLLSLRYSPGLRPVRSK